MDSSAFIKVLKEIRKWSLEDLKLFGYEDAFSLAFNFNSYIFHIINSFDDKKLQVINTFMYFYDDKIPVLYKEEIMDKVLKKDTSLYYFLPLFLNIELRKRYDYLDIINLFLHAKGDVQIKYGSLVANNKDVIKREDASKIINVVLNSNFDYQVKNASRVACDIDVLEKEDAIDYVYVISNAKGRHQAECASEIATNPEILKREDGICFTSFIANSNDIYELYYLNNIIGDSRLMEKNDPFAIVNIGYSIFTNLRNTKQYNEWVNYSFIDLLIENLLTNNYDDLKFDSFLRKK